MAAQCQRNLEKRNALGMIDLQISCNECRFNGSGMIERCGKVWWWGWGVRAWVVGVGGGGGRGGGGAGVVPGRGRC